MSDTTEGIKGGGYHDAHSEYQRHVAASGAQALRGLITHLGRAGSARQVQRAVLALKRQLRKRFPPPPVTAAERHNERRKFKGLEN